MRVGAARAHFGRDPDGFHDLLRRRPVPVSPENLAKILQPADVAAAVLMVCCLPPRAHVHEMIIKPTFQDFA